MLEIKNLSVFYGKNHVLKDISAVFPEGKITVIAGPNGSGKSTLLKAVSGIIPFSEGEIIYDSHSLFSLERKERAKITAYLSQGNYSSDMSVYDTVLMGRYPYLSFGERYSSEDKKIALFSMEKTGIAEYSEKSVSVLSGGMKQRVFLSTALCQQSEFFLLDEPNVYLDPSNMLLLKEIITGLRNEGKGIVLVAHDLPFIMDIADNIIVINEGRNIFSGDTECFYESAITREVFGISLKRCMTDKGYIYYYG